MQLHCRGQAGWQLQCHVRTQKGRAQALMPMLRPARPTIRGRCFSTSSDAGEVVRPSAQASQASPPAIADVQGQSSASDSSAPASLGPSGRSVGSASSQKSYSDLFKSLNSSQYGLKNGTQLHNNDHARAQDGNVSSNGKHHDQQQQSDITGANGSSQDVQQMQEPQTTQQSPQVVPDTGVEDAIKKAQEALAAAESSLSSIHMLHSAQPPNKWAGLLQVARSIATAAAAGAFLVASHAFGLGWQWAGATIGALVLAAQAFKQQNVTEAGAVAAAAACLATFGCSLRFGLVLLTVSYSSCKLRQYKESRVLQDYSSVQAGDTLQQQPRDWFEVVGVAAIPTILAIAYGAMAGCLDLPLGVLPNVEAWRADLLTLLQGAVLGWYACICGDSWSSELGELSGDQPRLLTTLKPVRKGTHGAVTLLGLSGAAAGGLLVGAVFYCAAVLSPTLWVFEAQRAAAMAQWRLVPLGLMAGLFGSLLDSLLGATLQFTGFDPSTSTLTSKHGPSVQRISGLKLPWLTDNVVNVLAASVTAALTAVAALAMFG